MKQAGADNNPYPLPTPLSSAGGRKVAKLSPGGREGWVEGVFKILLSFSLSYSDLNPTWV